MRRRPPRSTRVRSSAASDVYKRQVTEDTCEGSRVRGGLERGAQLLLDIGSAQAAAILGSDRDMVANDTVPLALRAAAAREPLPPGSLLALLAGYRVGRYA